VKSKKLVMKIQEGAQALFPISASIYAWGRRVKTGVLRTEARRVNEFFSKMGVDDGPYLFEKKWIAARKKKIERVVVPQLEQRQAQAIKSVQQELAAYLEMEFTGTMTSGFRGRHCFFRISVHQFHSNSHSDQMRINAFSGADDAVLIGISFHAKNGRVRLIVSDQSKPYNFLMGKKNEQAVYPIEKLGQVVAGIKKQVRGYRFVGRRHGIGQAEHQTDLQKQREIDKLIDVTRLLT
jgi:hypothetical protein